MNPDISRREFLKWGARMVAGAVLGPVAEATAASESLPRILPGGRIMETAEGLIPVGSILVQPGQSIAKIAALAGTRADLIIAANNLPNPSVIYPRQELRVPYYPQDPMMFIPEANIIRHQVRPGETGPDIANRYGISVGDVSRAKVVRQGNETYLTMRGITVPSLIPVKTNYRGDDLLPPEVTASLVQRVAHVMVYYLGGVGYLGPLRAMGVTITHAVTGSRFIPPDGVDIPLSAYTSREGSILKRLGHEMTHGLLGLFGWSPLSIEGAASRIASAWVSGRPEYAPDLLGAYYDPGYYDSVNGPKLRELNSTSDDQKARILAAEAWRRIDEFASPQPSVLLSLVRAWLLLPPRSRPDQDSQFYNWAKSKLIAYYGTPLAQQLIRFIEQQHILFKPDFRATFD